MSGSEAGSAWQGRFVGPLLAANVLVLGLTATLLVVGALRDDQSTGAARVMDQRTAVARNAVTTETGRYRDLMYAVAAGLGTNARLTSADFGAATAPLDRARLPGATSVAFVVPAGADEVARTQRLWRSRGATDLELRPADGAGEHYFSVFQRSLAGPQPAMTGLDVAPSREAVGALQAARRTGQAAVSDAYVLLRDRNLPQAQQQLSFLIVMPVVASAAETGGRQEFLGWLALGLHGRDFLGGVLDQAGQGVLDGELYARNGAGEEVQVAAYDARGNRDLTRRDAFPVADRRWTLVTGADSRILPGARTGTPTAVLLGGAVVTVMLALLVHILATGRSRARAQVLVATAELRTAEAESRRQAGLLAAIMASIGDGVGVVDGNGDFLLHNPAARALLGVDDDTAGPHGWQEHYGLYKPDGRTPFPLAELPLMRALRGEPSDGVEILVRNDRHPDGILVSVDGRPLDASAGQHGAVAVFHDITELRRYETDLAVFAGVVAHDLKAPLAVIRGHCETAADELADAPEGPEVFEARAALERIAQAVDRMAALIDTLLAYTTSRDAPLKLAAVPLGPLVADVVQHRTEHRRAGAGGADFYVGPLPSVIADAAMLRHVLDNLVGNAVKYVQRGRAARVDVTAAPAGQPGWTRIEVADRGIGIPDEDKPAVFETFHRATTAAGYAGTGLGLAICRRIVERHGGVIGVADNPGGGTRFHFTLPLAADRDPAAALGRALTERAAAERSTDRTLTERAAADRPVRPGAPAGSGTPAGPELPVRPAGVATATPPARGAGPAGRA